MNHEDKITYFGETDARNKRTPFGIRASDRTRHMYLIGKTGMGKSTLLENMAIQDIRNGEGFAFIDPHGKTADLLLDYIPQERMKDVLYFAPFDLEFPISFNVMEDVGADRRHLVANGLMSAFKKIWVDAWSARMEYILNNILLSLLEYPDSTLIGVNRMLVDKEYRMKVVENTSDPSVKAFWTDEFAKYGERYMQEAGAAIQNKIGQFISNPLVRNIIGQPKSTFDIRKLMDEKKILIVNLSKGRVGEANANLLGSMLITKIYLGAMSRADVSPSMMKHLPNFYLYVDEFQSFANESFADILSEARKYKLNLTIAHQYIEQMSDEVRAAVFGNVGSMMVFRVGAIDAEVLEKEFFPTFTKEDLVNLGQFQLYLKLMIDGVTSAPFSSTSLPPIEKPLVSFKEDIIDFSRGMYAQPRASVEDAIKKWHEPIGGRDNRSLQGKPPKRIIPAPHQYHDDPPRKPVMDPILAHAFQNSVPKPQQRSEPQNTQPREAVQLNVVKEAVPPSPVPRQEIQPAQVPTQNIPQSIPQTSSQKPAEALRQILRTEERQAPKFEPKKEKKDTKTPTPQNMNALRDALASVLKNTQNAPVEKAPNISVNINSQTVNNRTEVNQINVTNTPAQPQHSKKEEEKKHEPHQERIEQKTEQKTESKQKHKHVVEEVPEHILKKVLEL